MSRAVAPILLGLVVAFGALAPEARGSNPRARVEGPSVAAGRVQGARSYRATGTIKSFGPGRRYVNIAHDEIAGYMMPMTMSFEPKVSTQLDGLSEGMRVEFVFLDTEDHRRVIESITVIPVKK